MTTIHYSSVDGQTFTFESPALPPMPLDTHGIAATLNAVLGVWPLDDAANAVGLTADDLVAEAQAWEMAQESNT